MIRFYMDNNEVIEILTDDVVEAIRSLTNYLEDLDMSNVKPTQIQCFDHDGETLWTVG